MILTDDKRYFPNSINRFVFVLDRDFVLCGGVTKVFAARVAQVE
jgi:hypothetical protein